MQKQILNYETLLKVTDAISSTRDPEEIVLVTVESIKRALVKHCLRLPMPSLLPGIRKKLFW